MGSSQQFSLRWNNYLRHITGAFDSLRTDEDLVDVTLSCEGKKIRAHKMLLSACSSYFRDLFKENPCQHPVIIFKDVKYQDLEALVDFMYQGEVNVVQEQLSSFLNTAELLAVQGLTDGSSKDGAESDTSDMKANEDLQPLVQPELKKTSLTSATVAAIAGNAVTTTVNVNNRVGGPGSPLAKKRKCNLGVGASVNNVNKDELSKQSDLDAMEVIPVMPNVKVEQPDYYEQDCVGHYSDSVSREQSVVSANIDSVTKEEKKDSLDLYSSNSSDKNQHSSPLLDINQVMSVSGPSLDALPQEPLQDHICGECGAVFKYVHSLQVHRARHSGGTMCELCFKDFGSRSNLRKHFFEVHSWCLLCSVNFTTKAALRKHIDNEHGNIQQYLKSFNQHHFLWH
ncbi:uncharacterized protein LOC142320486 isoform X2 [Lycorma delicatula]|uniref:uncharacterized protein LOC142320486 isoform X2 n=1 Tax=Lycorma delicatula TaxID=130591 RepID=UPI003F51A693